jgi:DNA polymerase III sliding clamp (beta) subunit (PCNA family)
VSTATASGIQVQRIALLSALRSVADALPSGPTVNPADKAVLLQAAGDAFYLYANNREAWVRLRVEGWEGDELRCLIDHAKLSALLSGIGAAHVDLADETAGLRVRWGQSGSSLLPTLDVDVYVSAPSPENEVDLFTMEDAGVLSAAIRTVGYAAARPDEHQYRVLQSVHLASEEGHGITAWAASNVQQAFKKMQAQTVNGEVSATIPTNAARAVAAFLEAQKGEPVTVRSAEGAMTGYLRFVAGDSEILALLAANDDKYPIAVPRAMFTAETVGEFFVDRKSLLRVLALVKNTAPLNGRISLKGGEGEIIVSASDPFQGGATTERLVADVLQADNARRDYTLKYLTETLGRIDADEIRLRFHAGKLQAIYVDIPNDSSTGHVCSGLAIPD